MSDSMVQRYASSKIESFTDPATVAEDETPEDLGAFGYLRGTRERALMLELRKRDGNIMAIGYGYIERMEFDPSQGITLWALGKKIDLIGRHLNTQHDSQVKLFEALTRQRIPWIKESDTHAITPIDESRCVIDTNSW